MIDTYLQDLLHLMTVKRPTTDLGRWKRYPVTFKPLNAIVLAAEAYRLGIERAFLTPEEVMHSKLDGILFYQDPKSDEYLVCLRERGGIYSRKQFSDFRHALTEALTELNTHASSLIRIAHIE
jgi:hypothetical protein